VLVVDASVLAVGLADDATDGDRARGRCVARHWRRLTSSTSRLASVLRDGSRAVTSTSGARISRSDLLTLSLQRVPAWRPLRCWKLRHDLTVFDAEYVALAEALNVPLLTGDTRLSTWAGTQNWGIAVRASHTVSATPNSVA